MYLVDVLVEPPVVEESVELVVPHVLHEKKAIWPHTTYHEGNGTSKEILSV